MVKKGVPFRDAYKKIGLSLNLLPDYDSMIVLKASDHLGGPGNLRLANVKTQTKKSKNWWDKKEHQFNKTLEKLKES